MRTLLIFSLPFLLLLVSCGDDADLGGAELTGKWQLERATRNNMETALLDGLFYEFKEDGTLETNLMDNTQPGTYTLEGATIQTDGVSINMEYTIKEMTDSTLQLQSTYQGYQFGFELKRVVIL